MQTQQLIPTPTPPPISRTYTAHGCGQVGTGSTPAEARSVLMEMIRQAREA